MIPLLLRRPALVFALDCLTALTIGWTALLAPGYAREIVSTFTQSDAGLGLFYLLSALGYVGGSLFAGWLTERLGRRVVFVVAAALHGAGVLAGGLVPTWELFVLGGIVRSVGGGALDGGMNGLALDLYPGSRGRALNILHLFFAAGALCAELARPVNDRDWHVGLHLVFVDKAAHDAYRFWRQSQHTLRLGGARFARIAPDEAASHAAALIVMSASLGLLVIDPGNFALALASAALFGAGKSAPLAALYMKAVRPSLSRLHLVGRSPERLAALRARLAADPATVRAVQEAVQTIPGVQRLLYTPTLSRTAKDPLEQMAALSGATMRRGEFLLTVQRNWVYTLRNGADATHHNTGQDYNQRVPLILFGGPVRAGTFDVPVSPIDIAPTLASLVGVTMPTARGRVLR